MVNTSESEPLDTIAKHYTNTDASTDGMQTFEGRSIGCAFPDAAVVQQIVVVNMCADTSCDASVAADDLITHSEVEGAGPRVDASTDTIAVSHAQMDSQPNTSGDTIADNVVDASAVAMLFSTVVAAEAARTDLVAEFPEEYLRRLAAEFPCKSVQDCRVALAACNGLLHPARRWLRAT